MVELQTPLTRQLGIEVPIFSAGIGSAAGPELVAAVSNAGGFGVLGASAYNAASIGGLIARTRALTDRPFGVNIIIDDRDLPGQEIAELRDQVSAAIRERPAALVLFWGVLASGGIGDGAGIARALQLGAQAVSLGTRFVASDEAFVHPAYKRRIVDGKADDTILNELYDVWWPNAPHRTLRNKTSGEWEAAGRPTPGQRPGEGTPIGKRRLATGDISDWPRYAIGVATPDFDGDVEYAPLWAGESCSVVNDIRPAGELVRDLARDAANVLASVTA
ncbi:MAG: nitronate monooxygenase [Chloroflexi bacterium]|nr:MAG: nitronate monooxygenase [Chloroflexota bacterium]